MDTTEKSISFYQNNNRIQIVRVSYESAQYEFSFYGKLRYENPNLYFLLDAKKEENNFFKGSLYFSRYKTQEISLNNTESIPIRIKIISENPNYIIKRETKMALGSCYVLPKFKPNDLIEVELLPFIPFTIGEEYSFLQSFIMSFLPLTPRLIFSSPYHPLCSWIQEKAAGLNPDFLNFMSWFKIPLNFFNEKQYYREFICCACQQFSNETGFKAQPVRAQIESNLQNIEAADIYVFFNTTLSKNSIIPQYITENEEAYCLIASVMKNNDNYGIYFLSHGIEKISAYYSLFEGKLNYLCDLLDPPIILSPKDFPGRSFDQYRLYGITAIYASIDVIKKFHQIPTVSPFLPKMKCQIIPDLGSDDIFISGADLVPNYSVLSRSFPTAKIIMIECLTKDDVKPTRFVPMVFSESNMPIETLYDKLYKKIINFCEEEKEFFSIEDLNSLGVLSDCPIPKVKAFQRYFWYPKHDFKDPKLLKWLRYTYHPVVLLHNCILYDYFGHKDNYLLDIPAQNLVFLKAIDINPDQSKFFPNSFIELRFYRKLTSDNIIEYTHPPILIKRFDSKMPSIVMCDINNPGEFADLFNSINICLYNSEPAILK